MRVGLFIPCFVDQLAPQVGVATLQLLEALGCEVDFPTAQACCGQPLANLGCREDALPLAHKFARVFGGDAYDHVVAPSASCVAMVRTGYPPLAATASPDQREALSAVGERTRELCEFLVDVVGLGAIDGRYAKRVALQRGCHGVRELHLATASELRRPADDKVAALLGRLDGLELVEAERRDECCGFGGTFAVGEDAVSARMGSDRLDSFAAAGAEEVVATDVSCQLHLSGLGRRRGDGLAHRHVAEVLRDAVLGVALPGVSLPGVSDGEGAQ